MDFKSLMSAQIAKSKTPVNVKAQEPTTSKYQRRSDQEAKRQADYQAEAEALRKEREQRAEKKRKLDEEEAEQTQAREEKKRKLAEESRQRREDEEAEQERQRRKRLGLPELPDPKDGNETGTNPDSTTTSADHPPDIPDDELRTKLRELNEPITLFEETHTSRLRRYHKLTGTITSKRPKYHTTGPIATTLQPVEEKHMLLPADMTPSKLPPTSSAEYTFLHRQIASYLTLLLTEWSQALSHRTHQVKTSNEGQRAQQTYQTVVHDLTPLFRKLESQTLDHSLVSPIIEILHHIQKRQYVTANDTYLRMSIGKAAWPIGVTMVGIHERSAREKLHDGDGSKKAHIMADEQTRKMLQSLKRCLSFAQTRWPPDDIGQLMG